MPETFRFRNYRPICPAIYDHFESCCPSKPMVFNDWVGHLSADLFGHRPTSWMFWAPGTLLELDGLHHRSTGRLRPMGGVLTLKNVVGVVGTCVVVVFFFPLDFCYKRISYIYECIIIYTHLYVYRRLESNWKINESTQIKSRNDSLDKP